MIIILIIKMIIIIKSNRVHVIAAIPIKHLGRKLQTS